MVEPTNSLGCNFTPTDGGIKEAPSELSAQIFQTPRDKYIHSQRRFSAEGLADSTGKTIEELAVVVLPVLDSAKFAQVMKANLAALVRSHGSKGKDGSWVARMGSDENFSSNLVGCVREVGRELVAVLQREEQGGFLQREDLHLEALIQRKKPSRVAISNFLQAALQLNDAQKGLAFGLLAPVIKDAIAQTLSLAGVAKDHSTRHQAYVHLQQWPNAFGDNPMLRGRLAARFAESSTDAVLAHLEAVAQLPAAPTLPSQAQQAARLNQRFRRELAMMAFDPEAVNRALPSDGAHEKLTDIFHRLFNSPGIGLYLNYFSNERALMTRVLEGIRRGQIELCFISCPDYSGRVTADEGKPRWEFDFRELGDGIGVVARKGFRYVQAWHDALKPAVPDIRLTHIMPTFEVANGFQARSPQGSLDRGAAIERIERSGKAIAAHYQTLGLDVETVLSHDLIRDDLFVGERARLAEKLRSQSSDDPNLNGLLRRIFDSRRSLYASWQARLPEEDDSRFAQRMIDTVVPNHAAEYCLAGTVVTSRSPISVLLSYDSAIMHENYAYRGLPTMFGCDTSQVDYVGAAD